MYTIYNTLNFNENYDCFDYNGHSYFYRIEQNNCIIRTRMMFLSDFDDIFINFVFKKFQSCNTIKLDRVIIKEKVHNCKSIKFFKKFKGICIFKKPRNHVLFLPDTFEKYMTSLGKKTRQHLRQYQRHLDKDFCKCNIEYKIEDNENFNKETIKSIIRLIHFRRSKKGLKCETDENNVINELNNYIVTCYLKIDGKIVAGTISSIYNGALNLHNISHDDSFGDYNVGNLILLKTIEYAISKNIKVFNFLWRDCDYKERFGAVEQKLYNVYIYNTSKLYIKNFIRFFIKNLFLKVKIIVIKLIKKFYNIAKFIYHKTIKRKPKAKGYIFMLHRVDEINHNNLWCNENMKISPNFLDRQLSILKNKFDIIPLTEVPERITKKKTRQFIVFTMDDGYKDNYTKALPVFKKHNVPYTIFLSTDFADKNAILWWYELEELLLNKDSITLSNGVTYPAKKYYEKCESFLRIREEILKLDQKNLKLELDKLFNSYQIDWTSKCKELCLSWDDIKQLKNEELVTIGAHTKHHYNLKQLNSIEEVKNEIIEGNKRLHEKTGIAAKVFAYPFGTTNEVSKREPKIVSELDFNCACVAFGGPCTKQNKKDKFSLPRIMLLDNFKIGDLK